MAATVIDAVSASISERRYEEVASICDRLELEVMIVAVSPID